MKDELFYDPINSPNFERDKKKVMEGFHFLLQEMRESMNKEEQYEEKNGGREEAEKFLENRGRIFEKVMGREFPFTEEEVTEVMQKHGTESVQRSGTRLKNLEEIRTLQSRFQSDEIDFGPESEEIKAAYNLFCRMVLVSAGEVSIFFKVPAMVKDRPAEYMKALRALDVYTEALQALAPGATEKMFHFPFNAFDPDPEN